jgi:hypothetical protein
MVDQTDSSEAKYNYGDHKIGINTTKIVAIRKKLSCCDHLILSFMLLFVYISVGWSKILLFTSAFGIRLIRLRSCDSLKFSFIHALVDDIALGRREIFFAAHQVLHLIVNSIKLRLYAFW